MNSKVNWYEVRLSWGTKQQGRRSVILPTKREALAFYRRFKLGVENKKVKGKDPLKEEIMWIIKGYKEKRFPDSVYLVKVEETDLDEFSILDFSHPRGGKKG